MPFGQIEALDRQGVTLRFERQAGRQPTFVWLSGFKSDMSGGKATALATWARDGGQSFLRFDYSGHGQSSGRFEDGAIGVWLSDALAIMDAETSGPLVLVGSSMGAWIALLAAQARPERVSGLLLIAPAPDFTERLLWPSLDAGAKAAILDHGYWARPSAYDPEPYIITRALIEDGRRHLLMDRPYPFAGPVRILQGGVDPDVPPSHAEALASIMQSPDLRVDLIPDGDHRLSRPQDIAHLLRLAEDLARISA